MKSTATVAALVVLTMAAPARAEESSVAHKIGGAIFLTGSLIVITAIAVPIAVCKSRSETDSRGNATIRGNSCDDLTDGTKAAWIAGGGVGLTLAVFGGILYFETEPKQKTVALTPWVTREGGGAAFIARF